MHKRIETFWGKCWRLYRQHCQTNLGITFYTRWFGPMIIDYKLRWSGPNLLCWHHLYFMMLLAKSSNVGQEKFFFQKLNFYSINFRQNIMFCQRVHYAALNQGLSAHRYTLGVSFANWTCMNLAHHLKANSIWPIVSILTINGHFYWKHWV